MKEDPADDDAASDAARLAPNYLAGVVVVVVVVGVAGAAGVAGMAAAGSGGVVVVVVVDVGSAGGLASPPHATRLIATSEKKATVFMGISPLGLMKRRRFAAAAHWRQCVFPYFSRETTSARAA